AVDFPRGLYRHPRAGRDPGHGRPAADWAALKPPTAFGARRGGGMRSLPMPNTGAGRPRRRRRAAAAAELALDLPPRLLLGALDLGRFAYTYIAVTNAAGAGAFLGANTTYTSGTYTTWQAKVQQAAAAEMGSISGFTEGNVTATAVTESGNLW